MYRKTIFLSLVAALIFGITDTVLALDLKTQAQNEVIDNFIKQLITGAFFISFAGVTGLVAWLYSRVTGKRVEGAEVKEGDLVIVSRLRRITNFSIDFLVVINAIVAATSYGAIATEWYFPFENWLLFSAGIVVLYYWLLEGLFGRTIGKFFTNTKVVASDGSRAAASAILGRTLIRLIPFEIFSFLGTSDSGWHDRWSKTAVVKVGYKTTPTDERRVSPESGSEEWQVTASEPLTTVELGNLNRKWSHRLIKVAYFACFVAAALMVIVLVYGEYRPHKVPDRFDIYQNSIQCNNGKAYTAADLGVRKNGDSISQAFDWYSILKGERRLKRLCVDGDFSGSTPFSYDQYVELNSSKEKNYSVIEQPERYRIEGSLINVILFSIGGIILIALFFWLVNRVFHYICTGKS